MLKQGEWVGVLQDVCDDDNNIDDGSVTYVGRSAFSREAQKIQSSGTGGLHPRLGKHSRWLMYVGGTPLVSGPGALSAWLLTPGARTR